MNKVTAIIIGVLLVCFGGLIIWSVATSQADAVDISKYDPRTIISATPDNGNIGDHVRGKADSPITIVEYADFQCPGCATTHPQLNEVYKIYSDRVAFVFRNFPINSLHPNARAASAAVEAAGLQGYFFEMSDIVYSNQATWSYATGTERTDVFVGLFQQIASTGDAERFRTDMASTEITKKINFDYNLGTNKDNVTSTPTVLINGEKVDLTDPAIAGDFVNAMKTKLDTLLSEHGLPTGSTADTEATE